MKRKKILDIVRKHVTWWVKSTGLGYWDIKIQFGKDNPDSRTGDILVGEADVTWQYQMATITFYPKSMKNMSEDEIEKVVVHELMHVFLHEMHEEGIDHEERVATMLQKAFQWVKEADK